MSIYIFLANGFEEIETVTTIDILKRADLNIKTIGIGGKVVSGAHGISIICDIEEKDFIFDKETQMIILPGGMPGTLNLEKSEFLQNIITKALEKNLFIAAICAAPSILGHRGILKGKMATCYSGFERELIDAIISDAKVCQDGKIITARGPGVAIDFALYLVKLLLGEEKTCAIRNSLLID